MEELILGLDIGTTSVKAAIIDVNLQVIASHSLPSNANLPQASPAGASEHDVSSILTTIDTCLDALPSEELAKVVRIGVCGQMHGMCMWSRSKSSSSSPAAPMDDGFSLKSVMSPGDAQTSNLYTWMDARCDPAFLRTLPEPDSHLKLATGHGCATLFWLQRNVAQGLEKYEYAGTIMDFVVTLLCGSQKPLISAHNAASWGYFNSTRGEWNTALLEGARFPVRLLPTVANSSANEYATVAGQLHASWHGIPPGTSVGVALGDLQASVLSTRLAPDEAFINISTSAQIGHIFQGDVGANTTVKSVGIEYFPYFGGAHFAVGASLNGGNVLSAYVRMLQSWTEVLLEGNSGIPSEDNIWTRILQAAAESGSDSDSGPGLHIIPTLYGERHAPDSLASVTGISPQNTSIGHVTRALCTSLVQNLATLMPIEYLRDVGIQTVVVTGSTFRRNPILMQEVEKLFAGASFKIRVVAELDAAVGAAISVARRT